MTVTPNVALVSMPWAPVAEPSLGLGILKAQLTRHQLAAKVFHSNLQLLAYVTGGAYQQLGSLWGLNEFVFSGVLDVQESPAQLEAVLERCVANTELNSSLTFANASQLGEALIELRHKLVPQYLAQCAEVLLEFKPTLVGFSCMFDQTMASLALAKILKERQPDLMIVLGGYAVQGAPGQEVLNSFDCIDAIAQGDGEDQIVSLAQASIGRCTLESIEGVITRKRPYAAPVKSPISESPNPDYDDWFAALDELEKTEKVTVNTTVLPVEGSRGCWWGQKHHCVFCGIDEDTLVYRSKSPEQVQEMLAQLSTRYGKSYAFRFSDYILPASFYKTVLLDLAKLEAPYELRGEIKANQTEAQLRCFANAGFTELQPGIESFDTRVLHLMDKGVSGIQNVYLLKLGYRYGIQINYNLLYGLPGEQAEWYRTQIARLPSLFHLTPPVTRSEVIVTRNAPLHTSSGKFGYLKKPRHHRCYDTLFSEAFLQSTGFRLDDYAYYFERYFEWGDALPSLYWAFDRQVDRWKQQILQREVRLTWADGLDGLDIDDTRPMPSKQLKLRGLHRAVYLQCDAAPCSRQTIMSATACSESQLCEALDYLVTHRLVWVEGEQILGLAIPEAEFAKHQATQWHRGWTSVHI